MFSYCDRIVMDFKWEKIGSVFLDVWKVVMDFWRGFYRKIVNIIVK